MNNGFFHRVHEQTPTRMWINNVTREQAREAIRAGARGCTQNPSYVWKMMNNAQERPYVMDKLDRLLVEESDDTMVLIKLQRELVSEIAAIFMDVYEQSGGIDGYVSIQGDPFNETENGIYNFAHYNTELYPNMTAKIPVVSEALPAIRALVAERIPVNCTEIMAISQALDVAEIYSEIGSKMTNPAPLFYSVITGIFDEYLKQYVKDNAIDITSDVLWQAGIAVAKKIYWVIKGHNYKCRFIGGGARGLHHFTEMIGADCIVTINWSGTADKLIELDPPVLQRFFMPVPYSVEDELMAKLDEFWKAYLINGIQQEAYSEYGPVVLFRSSFERDWNNALREISERRKSLNNQDSQSHT